MTPHPTGSHVRLSPSPKGEGRKTTRLRVASNRRADWQVVLCARGARASSQGLCPPRLWRHEPQAKYNEEPPAKLVGSFSNIVHDVSYNFARFLKAFFHLLCKRELRAAPHEVVFFVFRCKIDVS